MIFPSAAFDLAVGNRQAAASVATMIYVGAVVNEEGDPEPEYAWCRPSMVTSMSDLALTRDSDTDRIAWADAALHRIKDVEALAAAWGIDHRPWCGSKTSRLARSRGFLTSPASNSPGTNCRAAACPERLASP
jgi:hypothetical protein